MCLCWAVLHQWLVSGYTFATSFPYSLSHTQFRLRHGVSDLALR